MLTTATKWSSNISQRTLVKTCTRSRATLRVSAPVAVGLAKRTFGIPENARSEARVTGDRSPSSPGSSSVSVPTNPARSTLLPGSFTLRGSSRNYTLHASAAAPSSGQPRFPGRPICRGIIRFSLADVRHDRARGTARIRREARLVLDRQPRRGSRAARVR